MSKMDTGFQTFECFPDALRAERLTIRCLTPEFEPELCSGWSETVAIEPEDVWVNKHGRLFFADHIPTECPECGDRVLDINGVEMNFHA